MRRHRLSWWLAAPIVIAPIASSVAATIDYIYVDGFEPGADCSAALACPAPAAGKSCISGQLTAAGSAAPLRAFYNAGLACGSGAIGGPCDLSLTVHDAVEFASNPGTSPPLASAAPSVDGCGRFRVDVITPPVSGRVVVVTDDLDPAPENNLHAPAATLRSLGANAQVDGVNVISARNDTNALWTQSAGSPFGENTFVDVGVILLQFSAGASPRAGVTVTLNGSTASSKDYYFSDAAPERIHVDGALAATGANGAALVVNNGFASYSGTGAEPMGCTWPQLLATSIIGVLLFVEIGC
jgi:hypothetical protein